MSEKSSCPHHIPNRYAFDGGLQREWSHAIYSGYPLPLLMIDIDNFRQ
ncbi:diguanylate cyclase domain-containing protein [Candidatus Venteria ishoeyi]